MAQGAEGYGWIKGLLATAQKEFAWKAGSGQEPPPPVQPYASGFEDAVIQQTEKEVSCFRSLREIPVASWAVPAVPPAHAKVLEAASFYYLDRPVHKITQPRPTLVRVSGEGGSGRGRVGRGARAV